jgi:hypothetical protein
MATVYNIELVSHWKNYSEKELKEIITNALKDKEKVKGNTITLKVEKK